MKTTFLFVVVISIFPFLFCGLVEAERMPAPEVKPVFYKGLKFVIPNTPQKMGYVEAWDTETNKKVWEKYLYSVIINPVMEFDVQWVFIKSLAIKDDKLVVVNENDEKFIIDIPVNKKNEQFQEILLLKSELTSLNLQNPEEDVERNFSQNDKRFIGIYGYTLHCPGIEEVDYNFIEQHGIRPIEGTSDYILSEEHGQLIASTINYAKQYNQLLLKKLKVELKKSSSLQLSPWVNKAPYPYENEDKQLVRNSYTEGWRESSPEKHPEVIRKAKEVLKEWGQSPDKYEYEGNNYKYKIFVSESPNFVSVVFSPIGLEGLERHVEVRMTKKDFVIVSILPGA